MTSHGVNFLHTTLTEFIKIKKKHQVSLFMKWLVAVENSYLSC
jgi:hypothetical protein